MIFFNDFNFVKNGLNTFVLSFFFTLFCPKRTAKKRILTFLLISLFETIL